jgi:hypothetical protein
MMKVASLHSSNHTTCKKCGNLLVAPEFSEPFSEEQVCPPGTRSLATNKICLVD